MNMHPFPNREIKSAGGESDADDIKSALGELTETTTAAIAALKAEMKAERDRADKLEMKMNRPPMGGGKGPLDEFGERKSGDTAAEHKALGAFAKTQDASELKAMSVGSDPAGGYVVMSNVSQNIRNVMRDQCPMIRLAGYQSFDVGDSWEQPREQDGDWGAEDVGETETRSETDNAELGVDTYPLREVYANVKVTQKLLDLSFIDIGMWIEGRLADKFGRKEGYNYILGNGVKAAMGLLSYPTTSENDFTRAHGKWQYVPAGNTSAVTADALKSLYWKLRAPFRTNATWLMASETANAIDKLKDGNGDYLWRDNMTAGAPPTLLGRPVEFDENMPAVAENALPIALGDFKRGYLIVERPGLKMLVDPYTAKPHVMFYATKRSGGGGADFHAIKFLKIAAA